MREELLRVDSFHLEVDGISSAGFTRCLTAGGRREMLEYREGGLDGVRLFPGALAPGRIVLERGLTRGPDLWEWFQRGDPRDGSILLLDSGGRERFRWRFSAGWPVDWKGPDLDAMSGEVGIERIEIAHEGIRWLTA